MRVVKQALSHFNIPPVSHFNVASDNTTVVPYINKVRGQDPGPSGMRQHLCSHWQALSTSPSMPDLFQAE